MVQLANLNWNSQLYTHSLRAHWLGFFLLSIMPTCPQEQGSSGVSIVKFPHMWSVVCAVNAGELYIWSWHVVTYYCTTIGSEPLLSYTRTGTHTTAQPYNLYAAQAFDGVWSHSLIYVHGCGREPPTFWFEGSNADHSATMPGLTVELRGCL